MCKPCATISHIAPALLTGRPSPRWSSLNHLDADLRRKERAKHYFDTLWTKPTAQGMRDRLFKYQPDLCKIFPFSLSIFETELMVQTLADLLNLETIYKQWISEYSVLNPIETQMCNLAAVICSNDPLQALWHTKSLTRHGGSVDQDKFVHDLALAIAKTNGCTTGDITPVDSI